MKILISGFDPFGEDELNASEELLKSLPDQIEDIEIYKVLLPTEINKSYEVLLAKIEEYNVDVLINIGQAKGRDKITLERVALNVLDFNIPDNGGNKYEDIQIREDGENAYFSSLPIKSLCEVLNAKGYECAISNSAGTYVCNYVMYTMQYLIHKKYPLLKEGFIHIPCLPQQGDENMPSMELNKLVDAFTYLIKELKSSFFKKEKVLVSACLLGTKCNYKGLDDKSEAIIEYLLDKEIYSICPECMGGLSTPRISCEIRGGKVMDKNGEDKSEAFRVGANKVLSLAQKNNIRSALLKTRSPSCGYGKVYDGTFSSKLIEGNGICAQLLKDNGIKIISSEDKRFKK